MEGTGKCRCCAQCCKWLAIRLKDVDYDKDWVRGRNGIAIEEYAFLPIRCQELTADNKCRIHDHKPRWCKKWPEVKTREMELLGCRFFDD